MHARTDTKKMSTKIITDTSSTIMNKNQHRPWKMFQSLPPSIQYILYVILNTDGSCIVCQQELTECCGDDYDDDGDDNSQITTPTTTTRVVQWSKSMIFQLEAPYQVRLLGRIGKSNSWHAEFIGKVKPLLFRNKETQQPIGGLFGKYVYQLN